jgi:hypothetical protein
MLRSEVRRVNGLSTIYVEGEPVWPMSFCSRHNDDAAYAARLREAGIRMWWTFCDTDWQRPTAFDELAARCELLLGVDPGAYLMVRVSLNPPVQWLRENPDELVRFENGAHHCIEEAGPGHPGTSLVREQYNGVGDYSLASDRWVADACSALGSLIDRVEAASFGRRVMGYFLNAGGTEEWYYGQTHDRLRHCLGFDPAFRRAFSRFLRRKYRGEVGLLRRAWADDSAVFDDPSIPSLAERRLSRSSSEWQTARARHEADFGSFLDPDRSQRIADFHEAWNAATGESLLAVARFIKEKTDRKALVGAFYGCQGCVLYHDFGTSKTSLALDSPDVDFLSAPTNYEDRVLGGGAGFTNPIDSMHLRGKCWINEDDNGTSLQDRRRWVSCLQSASVAEDVEIMKRDFARNLCEDAYAWWFENSWTDAWWNHPAFFPVMARMQRVMEGYYRGGRGKCSRIACLYDEDSIWYTDNETCKDAFQFNKIFELPRIGAPADHYFLEDVARPDFPWQRYAVFVVFNAAYVSGAKREAITGKLKRDGAVIVWVYAAGFMDPDERPQLSLEHARRLTGIDLAAEDAAHDLSWLAEESDHPYLRGMSRSEAWGRYRRPLLNGLEWERGRAWVLQPSMGRPLFYSRDGAATVLGRFTGGGMPAVVVKDMGGWTSVYVGSKVVPSDLIRNIARAHGVHVYCDQNDVLYANERFLAVHPSEEGRRTLLLPAAMRRVTEVFDDEVVAEDTDRFTVDLPFGVTRLYRLESS